MMPESSYRITNTIEEKVVKLQLISKVDFQSLLEYLRVEHFLSSPKPIIGTEYAYKGTDWTVLLRCGRSVSISDELDCELQLQTETSEVEGVAGQKFGIRVSLSSSSSKGVVNSFRQGLEEGCASVIQSLQRCDAEEGASSEVSTMLRELIKRAKTRDHPVYHETGVERWECRGKGETLHFRFSLQKRTRLCPLLSDKTDNEEEESPHLFRKRKKARGEDLDGVVEETYWLYAPCGGVEWEANSPETLMKELHQTLNILGIKATRHTIERAAEHIDAKRDVKIRIFSSYGYEEFLRKVSSLFFSPLSMSPISSPVEHGSTNMSSNSAAHATEIQRGGKRIRSPTSPRSKIENAKVEQIDYYYDTPQGHLAMSHCTLRFRGIKTLLSDTPTFELTLQSSISVVGGQQQRDWASLSLSPAMAARIEPGKPLLLEDLGKEGELWKVHLRDVMPEYSQLLCIAGFTTVRYKLPWFTSRTQPMHKTVSWTPSQATSKVYSPLVINVDHTTYSHFLLPQLRPPTGKGLSIYEVEITNIETCPESVMREMVALLNSMDVEWQLSVNNKLQQFLEFRAHLSKVW